MKAWKTKVILPAEGGDCMEVSLSETCSGERDPSTRSSGLLGGDFLAISSARLLSSSSRFLFSRSRISNCKNYKHVHIVSSGD